MKYNVYNCDCVLEIKEGGFESYSVNDLYPTGQIVELDGNMDLKEIITSLKKQGLIRKGIKYTSVALEGESDFCLYLSYHTNKIYRPELELRALEA